jgi:selenide,water dikinase
MQGPTYPPVSDLVLIGGGHTHALVLRMLAMDPLPGLRLTVVNPEPAAPYSGMLPGHIAGHYAREDLMIDLLRLGRAAGARVILDRVAGIDRQAQTMTLASGRPPLAYDLASIDIGITSDLPDLPGFAAHTVPAKPLSAYLTAWNDFLARALPQPRIAVLGAGVGGMELAFASAHRLTSLGARPQITVICRSGEAIPGVSAAARRSLLAEAARQGIALRCGAGAVAAEANAFLLEDGARIEADFLLVVAGARPHPWLGTTGLDLHQGFVSVGPTLQSSDPLIFAVGDCAHLSFDPRPKAGVFAVREAPVLLANLRTAATGKGQMQDFRPQKDYLKLISLGSKRAMADRTGLATGGAWIWRWKDRIDRRFMAMFHDMAMPSMQQAVPAAFAEGLDVLLSGRPLCGGCGAKIGPGGLSALAASLPAPTRADVLTGPGDDAAQLAAGLPGQVQVISTDHLRKLCLDEAQMATIAAVHALGDIWAMGATPQVALAQIVLPQMGERLQGRTLAEIMAAAARVFSAAGADVVGGHSTLGAELTIGFTVTGLTGHALTKAGAQPGDVLILTKPLGTGTILAAEMAGARLPGLILGELVATALGSMARPLARDAAILAPWAHAMTDVTGFGLAGHLMEMLEASGVAATIRLASLPLLPGAEALAAIGQASSLAPANRAALIGRLTAPPGPRSDLLFDPQTGGGLLATVPAASAPACLAALAADGIRAAAIGEITVGTPRLTAR